MFLAGVWFLILIFVAFVQNISICDNEAPNRVIVVALLNLHDETSNCTKVSSRGIQQQVILEKTAREINFESVNDGIQVFLNIVDSCSVDDEGLNAVSKSLVSSNQTCKNPPLLLGFIGPENLRQLYAVQQITSAFNKFHILPFPPDVTVNMSDSSMLYVANSWVATRSKILLAVLNQLGWKSIYVVVGENTANPAMLEFLLKEINYVCITGMSKIPKYIPKINTYYSSVIGEFQNTAAEGIVIIAEEPGNVRPLLEIMKGYSEPGDTPNPPILLYMTRVGLKSWELPGNFSILMLQETSGNIDRSMSESMHLHHLMSDYYEQYQLDYNRVGKWKTHQNEPSCIIPAVPGFLLLHSEVNNLIITTYQTSSFDAFADLLDPTILPLQYALKLYWNALKYARNIKCKLGSMITDAEGICPEIHKTVSSEWKTFLYKASYIDTKATKKISLQMKVPLNVKIFLTEPIVNTPKLIGHITEIGITELKVNLAKNFPKAVTGYPKKCLSSSVIPVKTVYYDEDPPEIEQKSWISSILSYGSNLFSLDKPLFNRSGYVNMIVIFTVITIFLVCLFLVVKCVYEAFKIKSEEEREYSIRRKKGFRTSRVFSS